VAWRGLAWLGVAGLGRRGRARPGKAGLGEARQANEGPRRYDVGGPRHAPDRRAPLAPLAPSGVYTKATHEPTGQAGLGPAWRGMARRGLAGVARLGVVGRGLAGQARLGMARRGPAGLGRQGGAGHGLAR
jgi:hypothetical protein